MDLRMKTEEMQNSQITWDCKVVDGIVPIISDGDEELQTAVLAGFLVRGTVPQLPNAGVPWSDFLTGKMTFGELDYYVRDSLQKVEKETYYPQYELENGKITMKIGKMTQEEA